MSSSSNRSTVAVIAMALSAAALRLLPLNWLHPLNWDELEFYRATSWIAEGRLPYRDFWEHHTPLAWFVFAPFTWLTKSPGADAIILMRWAQIPVWIATFWLAAVWMRNAGIERFARWAAMAIALASSFLMIAAVEYRVDPLSCLLFLLGLVLAQRASAAGPHARWAAAGAGAAFCLTGYTNIRLGPLAVITVLLLRFVDPRERKWSWRSNAQLNWMFAGAAAAFAAGIAFFAATGSLSALYRHVWVENVIGDRYGTPIVGGFIHRLLVPFGVRVIASDRLFELAAVDVGGIVLLVAGAIGMVRSLAKWKQPDDLFVVALLQTIGLVFIARMNFVYNYHFETVAILMLPMVAATWMAVPRRGVVIALVAVATAVSAFACVFRGKELDLAYQDFVMREVDARTKAGDPVWSGITWAIRREPAYYFWFLPDMTRHLVRHGYARPYLLQDVLRNPPAALVVDHYALLWMVTVQRELAPYFIRHYIPVWRNVWIPGLNVKLRPGTRPFEWIAPADGIYRVYASAEMAKHAWFRDPLYVASYEGAGAERHAMRLPAPGSDPHLRWWVDRTPVPVGASLRLRKGQRVAVAAAGGEPLGIVLLPSSDTLLFRQPPPGATLEAATSRITHVPDFHVQIDR